MFEAESRASSRTEGGFGLMLVVSAARLAFRGLVCHVALIACWIKKELEQKCRQWSLQGAWTYGCMKDKKQVDGLKEIKEKTKVLR